MNKIAKTGIALLIVLTPLLGRTQVVYDFGAEIGVGINSQATNITHSIGYLRDLKETTWADVTNKCTKLAEGGTARVILLKGSNITSAAALAAAESIKHCGIKNVPILCQVNSRQRDEKPLYIELGQTNSQTLYEFQIRWMKEEQKKPAWRHFFIANQVKWLEQSLALDKAED